MQNLIQQINRLCDHSRERLVLEAGLKNYMERELQIVSQQQPGDLTETAAEAVAWGCALSRDNLYLEVGKALQKSGSIDLPDLKVSGRHSLTWRDATWLLMQHVMWGEVAILQRNFSCEAVLFSDLGLLLIRREGRLQQEILYQMLRNVLLKQDEVMEYLSSKPTFGGINFTFPNPFHTINYGHTALYRMAQEALLLRTVAWVDPASAWFDPAQAFPTLVRELRQTPNPCTTFLELTTTDPIFLIKPGHVYRNNEEPLNRQVEVALLASSGSPQLAEQNAFRLWLGLTSGKRALANEIELMVALVKMLVRQQDLKEIVIDGWTGSSMKGISIQDAPKAYSSHGEEFEQMREAITRESPEVKVRTLIGCCYEEKVREALSCDFFCSSAYTASILPSRFCALPGIVHTSNRGLAHLRMHIHRRANFVPPELIEDLPFDEGLHPLDTSYTIPVEPFLNWVQTKLLTTEQS
jgi:hypothetical protein